MPVKLLLKHEVVLGDIAPGIGWIDRETFELHQADGTAREVMLELLQQDLAAALQSLGGLENLIQAVAWVDDLPSGFPDSATSG